MSYGYSSVVNIRLYIGNRKGSIHDHLRRYVTFTPRINIISIESDEFTKERLRRKKKTYEGTCSEEESVNLASWWEIESGGDYDFQESEGKVKYSRKKALWERFEDQVWGCLINCGMKYASSGLQVIRYGEGKKQIKQVDGIFSDDDYVYIVESKWRQKKDGNLSKDTSIKATVVEYRSFWKPLTREISVHYPDFSGKDFVFILASRGVDLSDIEPELCIGKFGYSLPDESIDELNEISGKLSTITNSIFRSEVMRGREVQGEPTQVYALKTQWSGTEAYSFYIDPNLISDRFYVHKSKPGNRSSMSLAYQRVLKPSKVGQISTYLQNTEGFFPNSIIAHCDKIQFAPLGAQEQLGLLTIPEVIGSIWIIDGQHRVFGTLASGSDRKLNFCLLVNTTDIQQARLFTTINEKQTKIPLDLIWDLHGSLGSYSKEPPADNPSKNEELRKYFISRTWKKINDEKKSPFYGRIVIPSQTNSSRTCHIQFGFLCKYLNQTKLWENNRLRSKKWKNAHLWAYRRLNSYFTGIRDGLPDEWAKEKRNNWLLSQYSLMVQLMVFRQSVFMFSQDAPFRDDWIISKEAEDMTYNLGKRVAKVISIIPDYEDEITNAGNAKLRGDWRNRVISRLKKLDVNYQHLGSNLDLDEDEKEDSHYLNPKQKDTIAEVEKLYRKITFMAYTREHGIDWFGRLPGDVIKRINQDLKTRKKFGEEDLELPSKKYLDSITLGDLRTCLSKGKIWSNQLNKHFPCKNQELWNNWEYYTLLRHAEAHNRPIADTDAKNLWLAAMKFVKLWGEEAFVSMVSEEE